MSEGPQFEDFNAAVRELRKEPITFKLGETVFAVPQPLPAIAFMEYAKKEGTFADFILGCVEVDQAQAFEDAVRETRVSYEVLQKICNYITEASLGRPTNGRSASRGSSSTTGAQPRSGTPKSSTKSSSKRRSGKS